MLTGLPTLLRAQTHHPLDPLTAAEISVAVATVRTAGSTPEVIIYSMHIDVFVSVSLIINI